MALFILFQNMTVAQVQAKLVGLSPSQIFSFFQTLKAADPGAANAVRWDISYQNLGTTPGLAYYTPSTLMATIELNINLKDDPIGSGFVLAHEIIHISKAYNPASPLSGNFTLGTTGTQFESIDHLLAYQITLGIFPDVVKEYIKAGQIEKAAEFAARFDGYMALYEQIRFSMVQTLTALDANLASYSANLSANAVISNNQASWGPLTISTRNADAGSVAAGYGPFVLEISVITGGSVFKVNLFSNVQLTQENIAALVTLLVAKVKKNLAMAKQALTSAQLQALRAKIMSVLVPVNAPGYSGSSREPTNSNGTFKGGKLSGVKVVYPGGIATVQAGDLVEVLYTHEGLPIESVDYNYNYSAPLSFDGGLGGGFSGGCIGFCPLPQ